MKESSLRDHNARSLLPLLQSKGLAGLSIAEIREARGGIAHGTGAAIADRMVALGYAFHTFRPRNGKAGRAARAIVAMEFSGFGDGGMSDSGWVSP